MNHRWLLFTLIAVADAAAIWIGVQSAPNTSFLLVLAAASAVIAFRRPALAAGITLCLVVPTAFLALMAGPAHCDGSVARVGGILLFAHALVLALSMLARRFAARYA